MLSLRILTTLKNLKVGDLMIPVLNPLCREYFEKVKIDYKERVKNFQEYLDFVQNIGTF